MGRTSDKSTKANNKYYDTRSKHNNLKRNTDSDSSDDLSSFSDSNSEEEEMDMHEYRKMVQKIFPSKFMKNKIKAGVKENKKDMKKNKNTPKSNHNQRNYYKLDDSSSDDSDEYDTSEEEIIENEANYKHKRNKKRYNIIFTIDDFNKNRNKYDTEDEDDDDDEYDEDEDEDEDEYDEYEDDDEDDDEDDEDDDEDDEDDEYIKRNMQNKERGIKKQQETILEVRKTFETILEKDKTNKIALEGLKALSDKERSLKQLQAKKVNGTKVKNVKQFKKLINKKSLLNDYKYFKDELTVEEQQKILCEVEELNKYSIVKKPYRLTLLESNIPTNLKAIALNKISSLRYMDPGNGEYYKIKNWVDTFMQIPFNTYKSLPITMDDGVNDCQAYMETAKDILDQAVYGLNDAKMQIMQMVGQWISNPKAVGTAIAIKGPMGTGKTTLVKEGISKILNRDFAFIALGGATDSSFLEGHSYTYEGSTWGKIVDILVKTKSMNPVIYFDELDKISETPKGEELAGILTHLTDTSQNSEFHDKYFSEIDFDLSKCLFIFSYNDESKVNPILLDRMYKIQTKGYQKKDKQVISRQYLIPKIQEQVNFNNDEIIIPDETIDYIVETYTEKENGVRNLKRCLEIIYTKINLYRLMKPDSKLFNSEDSLKVEFPFTVTSQIVRKLIKKDEPNMSYAHLYI
jgi:ATP-dependent Lon protease